MKKTNTLLLVLSLGLFTSCGTTTRIRTTQKPVERNVTILAVNDMHAAIDAIPRLAFVADSLRALYPGLLLVSAGDNQTGDPANDMYQPTGYPMISLMNDLGFVLSAVGNHEFDSGLLGFEYLSQQAKFPFISANVFKPADSPLKLQPYVILTQKDGTKVFFVSLLDIVKTTGIPPAHPDQVKGFTFRAPLELAREFDDIAKTVDIPIFINHLGLEIDKELTRLLDPKLYPLIIGGHSHDLVPENTTINGVYLTQAKNRLSYATLIQVKKRADGSYDIRSQNIQISKNKEGQKDPAFAEKVNAFLDNPSLQRVLGKFFNPLPNKEQIGYFVTDALLDYSKADFAIVNKGNIRVETIPQGEVTVRDIFTLDPFGNEAVNVSLTGHQLIDLLKRHFAGDGYKVCYPAGFQIRYKAKSYEEDEFKDTEIELFDLDGKPLDLDKTYTVAMNSYISAAFLPEGATVTSLYKPTAELTMEYIAKLKTVPSYNTVHRVELITIN